MNEAWLTQVILVKLVAGVQRLGKSKIGHRFLFLCRHISHWCGMICIRYVSVRCTLKSALPSYCTFLYFSPHARSNGTRSKIHSQWDLLRHLAHVAHVAFRTFPEGLVTQIMTSAESPGHAYSCFQDWPRQHRVHSPVTFRGNGTPRGLEGCLFLPEGSE